MRWRLATIAASTGITTKTVEVVAAPGAATAAALAEDWHRQLQKASKQQSQQALAR
jgi:hypothetical protein